MNVLQKCCFRSMKENRKRTTVTIIGIIMATALITGVACLAVSFRASLIEFEKKQNGDYHYCFSGVKHENLKYFENNRNIRSLALAGEVGYAALPESRNPDKPYLYIRALNAAGMKAMSLKLTEGRMPENSSELVISRHIRANGLVDYQIGDVLELDIGQRISDGYQLNQNHSYTYEEEQLETYNTKSYTIVGIVERPNYGVEKRMAPGYSVFTYLEEPEAADSLEVFVTYTDWALRHADKVNAGILGVSEDLYRRYYRELTNYTTQEEIQIRTVADSVEENIWLIKWVIFSFSKRSLNMLYSMSAVAITIIMVTSVFCIRNSFTISLMEKMKLYGRLASVGASSRQQRRIVYIEAGFLGLVGIPLGILSGILASVILVHAVSGMMESAIDIPMVFGISLPAILAAVLLSAVTIFFSSLGSARKAAKVSPISAIRSNDTVKIRRRELKCPGFIHKIFGVGGTIAYKNLKRARVKYRTTVVSIVISVTVFIGMNTFVWLVDKSTHFYRENQEFQLMVSVYDDADNEKSRHIAAMEGVLETEIPRFSAFSVSTDALSVTEEYKELYGIDENMVVCVYSIGESAYERFCRDVGVSPEEAEDKAVVIAEYEKTYQQDNKLYSYTGKVAHFKPGDMLCSVKEPRLEVEVAVQTEEKPRFLSRSVHNTPVLIVSDGWMDSHLDILSEHTPRNTDCTEIYIKCKDASQLEEDIRRYLELSDYTVNNYDAQYRSERSLYTVIAIFLSGFITVVALIGITNIFNTVTTNMELRAPEFAMLKSIGMTDREFRRMIWLEGLFYGGKALLIGLPLGTAVSFAFSRALGTGIVLRFHFPFASMVVSAAAVFILLFGIMRYSMGKLNRRNLIEIIQNENI